MQQFIVTGNLTRDPVSSQTPSGIALCKFSVAVNRSADADGERKTDFFDFTAFRKLAELVGRYCKKGNKVLVTARLETNNYEDKDGVKHYGYNFIAYDVEFLTPKGDAESQTEKGTKKAQADA